jgi:hypothetical protein
MWCRRGEKKLWDRDMCCSLAWDSEVPLGVRVLRCSHFGWRAYIQGKWNSRPGWEAYLDSGNSHAAKCGCAALPLSSSLACPYYLCSPQVGSILNE